MRAAVQGVQEVFGCMSKSFRIDRAMSDTFEQKALKERGIDKMLADAMENNKDYEANTGPR